MIKQKEEQMTEEQKKVMRTQDIGYVEMKRVAESKVKKALHHELISAWLRMIGYCVSS